LRIVAHRRAADFSGGDDTHQADLEQGHVARLDGDIRPGAHAKADIGLRQSGGVVDAIADHAAGIALDLEILGGVESFQLLGLFLGPAIMAALMLLWRQLTTFPADQRDALVISKQTGP
jgi:hypothetical protein